MPWYSGAKTYETVGEAFPVINLMRLHPILLRTSCSCHGPNYAYYKKTPRDKVHKQGDDVTSDT